MSSSFNHVYIPNVFYPYMKFPARAAKQMREWRSAARNKKARSGLQSACDELIDKGAINTGE
jgi:hypothetical protein